MLLTSIYMCIYIYTKCASIKKSLLVPDTKINVYDTHKTLDFGHREKGNTK